MAELSEKAQKQINDIAKVFAAASGGSLPEPSSKEMGLFSRATRNIVNAWRAVRGEQISSVQSRFDSKTLDEVMGIVTSWACQSDYGPAYGTMDRDRWLHDFVFSEKSEPILNGAVHTFTAKVQTINWFVEGPEDLVARSVDILENADYEDWTKAVGRWVNQYAVLEIGGLMELGWENNGIAGLDVPQGLYVLDGTCCRPTINYDVPFVYYDPVDGRQKKLRKNSVMQLLSMPNPKQEYRGLGMSPVSRALRAAKLLDTLHRYEEERLSNLPPEGIATVTGMTMDEVKLAMDLYKEKRESKQQYTFPGILWLVATKMPFGASQRPIRVDMTPFSTLPSYFDKKTTVELFVKTLAITFGVDVAEFWQIESHGATKAQATIQAEKAKGKGVGLILSQIEREISQKLLPPGVTFRFDVQHDQDDYFAAEINTKKIDNIIRLYYGKPSGAIPQPPLISWEEGRYLLVREGVIPKEFSSEAVQQTLEPSSIFKIYSHKLKDYARLPNPFPQDQVGMAHAIRMLERELSKSIGESIAHRPTGS